MDLHRVAAGHIDVVLHRHCDGVIADVLKGMRKIESLVQVQRQRNGRPAIAPVDRRTPRLADIRIAKRSRLAEYVSLHRAGVGSGINHWTARRSDGDFHCVAGRCGIAVGDRHRDRKRSNRGVRVIEVEGLVGIERQSLRCRAIAPIDGARPGLLAVDIAEGEIAAQERHALNHCSISADVHHRRPLRRRHDARIAVEWAGFPIRSVVAIIDHLHTQETWSIAIGSGGPRQRVPVL